MKIFIAAYFLSLLLWSELGASQSVTASREVTRSINKVSAVMGYSILEPQFTKKESEIAFSTGASLLPVPEINVAPDFGEPKTPAAIGLPILSVFGGHEVADRLKAIGHLSAGYMLFSGDPFGQVESLATETWSYAFGGGLESTIGNWRGQASLNFQKNLVDVSGGLVSVEIESSFSLDSSSIEYALSAQNLSLPLVLYGSYINYDAVSNFSIFEQGKPIRTFITDLNAYKVGLQYNFAGVHSLSSEFLSFEDSISYPKFSYKRSVFF